IVKIPMTWAGIQAIKTLSSEGIRTNCTLVFNLNQATLSAKVGATYVSPFLGRLDSIGPAGGASLFLQQLIDAFCNYDFETKILGASIRTLMHFSECIELGVDTVTCGLPILKSLIRHPLTDEGLAKFSRDYQQARKRN
ncbi:MAG: fructose-6-phosphate aldolase, partial [Cytophagales bacterium]|nr:fructose-6-phosphate aldolase [Cytophagales bacterium]